MLKLFPLFFIKDLLWIPITLFVTQLKIGPPVESDSVWHKWLISKSLIFLIPFPYDTEALPPFR